MHSSSKTAMLTICSCACWAFVYLRWSACSDFFADISVRWFVSLMSGEGSLLRSPLSDASARGIQFCQLMDLLITCVVSPSQGQALTASLFVCSHPGDSRAPRSAVFPSPFCAVSPSPTPTPWAQSSFRCLTSRPRMLSEHSWERMGDADRRPMCPCTFLQSPAPGFLPSRVCPRQLAPTRALGASGLIDAHNTEGPWIPPGSQSAPPQRNHMHCLLSFKSHVFALRMTRACLQWR